MNKVKYFQRGGKNLPTAPDAKEAYKGGTYVPSVQSGESNNNNYFRKPFTSRVKAVPVTDYISREISQFINPITNDTVYKEVPYHDTEVRIKPRRASTRDTDRSEYNILNRRYNEAKSVSSKQQGGTMNQQQDIQQQVIQLVQAAMQGDQKATETVNQIMQAAQQGDQQAVQLAQMIKQVVEQMKGQATSAKWGSKLGYIRSLKYAKGGKTCPTCQNGGKPLQTPIVKKSTKKIEEKACGGKAKKRYFGGYI